MILSVSVIKTKKKFRFYQQEIEIYSQPRSDIDHVGA